jgi:hypothetical protein
MFKIQIFGTFSSAADSAENIQEFLQNLPDF